MLEQCFPVWMVYGSISVERYLHVLVYLLFSKSGTRTPSPLHSYPLSPLPARQGKEISVRLCSVHLKGRSTAKAQREDIGRRKYTKL